MVQEALALKGRTVAITRPREQAEETSRLIQKYGGKPYSLPTIEIKETGNLSSVKRFIDELEKEKVDYVIFMSPNGIKYLLSCAEKLGMATQLKKHLVKTVTMAVGPKTEQESKIHNIAISFVPAEYSSEGILQCLQRHQISGKSIYIPRTSSASPFLANKLREMGGKVQEIYVYESLLPVDQKTMMKFFLDLIDGKIHAILFSSSLGAKNFFQMFRKVVSERKLLEMVNSRLVVVAIGPMTAKTLSKKGVRVDVMPNKYLFEEALIALARCWDGKG